MYKEVLKCRLCGGTKLTPLINLGTQKLTGVFPLPEEHEAVEEVPLEIVKCTSTGGCGLVQLRHSCLPESMYGENYGYRSGLNLSMVRHLEGITSWIKKNVRLQYNDIILDIGSNDGTTLKSYKLDGMRYVGMDPTAKKFRDFYPMNITVVEDFFSANSFKRIFGEDKAKAITSIAMFYDLENPISFVENVYDVLHDEGVWVFEQSYLPAMIDSMSFDTICQEHLEYYTLKQIKWITDKVGMKIIDVQFNNANGGSFRIAATKKESSYEEFGDIEKIIRKEHDEGYDGIDVYKVFCNKLVELKKTIKGWLEKQKAEGNLVYGYGASTKGNVLLQYFDIKSDLLPKIAEVNGDKYGHVTPGTCIQIVSEDDAKKDSPDYFFVLPWHFKDNLIEKNREYMKKSGCRFVFPLPVFEIVDCESLEGDARKKG